jgi:glycosyltransferase involved in cell wall biosynthesis
MPMTTSSPEILLLPRYSDAGPSSRLRMTQFVPRLEAAGFCTRTSPFFSDRYLDRYFADGTKDKREALASYRHRLGALARQRADVLWIEKEAFPFLPAFAERMISSGQTPYVVDFDDAIFHTYDRSKSGLVRAILGEKLKRLIRNSSAIFAGNEYLAQYAHEAGARTVVSVPTVVEPARYPLRMAAKDGPVRVGWIGTPANARYLAPCVAAMNALADRQQLELVTIGADRVPGVACPQKNLAWSEENEGELLSQIDIGVMPLTDTAWERGKCGYKLIQYMAAGKPVIASPVGVNSTIAIPEVGFLAADHMGWVAALDELAGDRALRERMGEAARRRVEKHYSVEAVAPTIVNAFRFITELPVA